MNTNAIDANKALNQAIQAKGVTQNADVKVEPEAADKVQPVVQNLILSNLARRLLKQSHLHRRP